MNRLQRALSATPVLALAAAAVLALPQTGCSSGGAGEAKMSDGATAAKDMVEGTASIGSKAPQFVLTDTGGKVHRLADYKGKVVVLEWFNPDCPFVKKHHAVNKSMSETFGAVKAGDVVWLAVNSGAPGKQGAGLDRNQSAIKEYGISYPVLLDESGVVGKAYNAKTTPHMFIIDKDGVLRYAGAPDDDSSPNVVGATNYVISAVKSCKEGKVPGTTSTQSYGCSVKYGS